MILYCYDESGVYTGPVSAALSPARPFVNGQPNYLLPARSTTKAPPAAEPGTAPLFDGKDWKLVEDHRGKHVFDTATGQRRAVTALGPLPAGCALQASPSQNHVWDGSAWREDAAKLLDAARRERNGRLAACDWTQLADSPLNQTRKNAWAFYRQALRDYPGGWTKGKAWPEPPKE
jgi:hypothetical protein